MTQAREDAAHGKSAPSVVDTHMLVLDDVSIAFGKRIGLRALSMQVRAGERMAVLGPSGVGKSSLLRAIAGLHPVISGRVLLDGRDITALAPEHRGIVYLQQTPALFPHMSVLDNVAFPLEVRGVSRAESRAQAQALLRRVQLEAFGSRRPTSLSGGQRHRVALARALAAKPRVLLLDEPFAALDPMLRAEVRDDVFALLSEISVSADSGGANDAAQAPPAVLLVTHDIDEAVALTHRVVVLLGDRVAQDDRSVAVLERPASLAVARFLGVPNLVRGVRDTNGVVTSSLGTLMSNGRAGEVWLAFRPDALHARSAERPAIAAAQSLNDAAFVAAEPTCGIVVELLERMSGAMVRIRVGTDLMLAIRDGGAITVNASVDLLVDVARVHVIDEVPRDV